MWKLLCHYSNQPQFFHTVHLLWQKLNKDQQLFFLIVDWSYWNKNKNTVREINITFMHDKRREKRRHPTKTYFSHILFFSMNADINCSSCFYILHEYTYLYVLNYPWIRWKIFYCIRLCIRKVNQHVGRKETKDTWLNLEIEAFIE